MHIPHTIIEQTNVKILVSTSLTPSVTRLLVELLANSVTKHTPHYRVSDTIAQGTVNSIHDVIVVDLQTFQFFQ